MAVSDMILRGTSDGYMLGVRGPFSLEEELLRLLGPMTVHRQKMAAFAPIFVGSDNMGLVVI